MRIEIDRRVLTNYTEVTIGFLVVKNLTVEPSHSYVEAFKARLEQRMHDLRLNVQNLVEHPDITVWRRVYGDMGVKPSAFRSSIESLVRRVVRGQGVWRVSSVVDLYNCVSTFCLLPMGGYDVAKLSGDIELRYGQDGESFFPLGSDEVISVESRHVVYADSKKVLCWLWNHRDSRLSAIDMQTREAVFFMDTAYPSTTCSVEEALEMLSQNLSYLGAIEKVRGTLNSTWPMKDI